MKKYLCFFSMLLLCVYLQAQIPTTGLVAYYKLDGNLTDSWTNALNGTNFGATATPNNLGLANKAMNFANPTSTVAQYATAPVNSFTNFTGDFSVSFLTMHTSFAHPEGYFDNNLNYNGYGIYAWTVNGFNQVQFNFKNNSVGSTAAAALTLNQWYHIVAVRSAGTLKLYISGFLNNSASEGTNAPVYTYPARIGSMFFNGFSPPQYNGLDGKMDELRIYNRALTPLEILEMTPIILPLKLENFTAAKQGGSIRLDWETLSEVNTRSFDIERSSNGINFVKTGEVPALGNSATKHAYQFTDPSPQAGTDYYRLALYEQDGSYTYSRILAVKNEMLTSFQFFPNPVIDVMQLQIPSLQKDEALVSVVDAAGKTVLQNTYSLSAGTNAISLPLHQLNPGNYFLHTKTSTAQTTKAFIKQ